VSAPFMQLYVADYLGDTRHLTTEQHGAYLLLLMTMWRADGRLPHDDKKLARITGCTASRWARIKGDVLDFFDVDGADLTHGRLMLELKKASEKSFQRAEAGKRGGEAKSRKDKDTPVANATDLPCHSSDIRSQKEDKEPTVPCPAKPDARETDLFLQGWAAYPSKGRERSKSKAKTRPIWRDAAKAAGGQSRLLGAIQRYVRDDATHKGECGPPAFDRWLRDGRWEHWLPEGRAPAVVIDLVQLEADRRLLESAANA
jgi:uncharacterized protein YdaU (DUF1376 family)